MGAHLLTIHNVTQQIQLMQLARKAIIEATYPSFLRSWFRVRYQGAEYPIWAVEALRGVGVDLLANDN